MLYEKLFILYNCDFNSYLNLRKSNDFCQAKYIDTSTFNPLSILNTIIDIMVIYIIKNIPIFLVSQY